MIPGIFLNDCFGKPLAVTAKEEPEASLDEIAMNSLTDKYLEKAGGGNVEDVEFEDADIQDWAHLIRKQWLGDLIEPENIGAEYLRAVAENGESTGMFEAEMAYQEARGK